MGRRHTTIVSCIIAIIFASACSGTPASESNFLRLNSSLIELHREYVAYVSAHNSESGFVSRQTELQVTDGRVVIDVTTMSDTGLLEDQLRNLGATNIASVGLTVSCYFPIARIDELSGISGLRFARPAIQITH